MEDDAVLQVVFFNKRLEFWSIIVMDDMQLEVVSLGSQSFDGAQDAAEVLGFIAQGRNMKHSLFPAMHVIPTQVCAQAGIYARLFIAAVHIILRRALHVIPA
jgi:hypothetical protein